MADRDLRERYIIASVLLIGAIGAASAPGDAFHVRVGDAAARAMMDVAAGALLLAIAAGEGVDTSDAATDLDKAVAALVDVLAPPAAIREDRP